MTTYLSYCFKSTHGLRLLAISAVLLIVGFFITPNASFAAADDAVYGNYVWLDSNLNGLQDDGEEGINGIRVDLYLDNGDGEPNLYIDTLARITYTADDGSGNAGFYEFTDLPPGDYFAAFYLPPTYWGTGADIGDDDTIDSDGTVIKFEGLDIAVTSVTTLEMGETDPTWDQGFYKPGSGAFGNYVWYDLNGNGIQDESLDLGINGVTIRLYDENNVLVDQVTTRDDIFGNPGYYQINFVQLTSCTIEVVLPDGFIAFTSQDTTAENIDSDANALGQIFNACPIGNGEYNDTFDAGLIRDTGPLKLGDVIWFDDNANGIYEPGLGEMGIDGVEVNLYLDSNNDGFFTPGVDAYQGKTNTSTMGGQKGTYMFNNLAEGNYIIQVDRFNFTMLGPLFSLASSHGVAIPDNNVNNDDNCALSVGGIISYGAVTLPIELTENNEPTDDGDANNNSNLSLDCGFIDGAGSIGDRIWFDVNGNGVQDPGEPGIAGVEVTLMLPDGSMISMTTDENGEYMFTDLPAGSYKVTVNSATLPPDLQQTYDPDGTADSMTTVFLADGGLINTADFGYRGHVNLGNFIFEDTNRNGFQDDTNSGIEGVKVNLYIDNDMSNTISVGDQLIAMTMTDEDGFYQFSGLIDGKYIVGMDQSNFLPLTGALSEYGGATNFGGDPDNNTPNDSNCVTAIGFGIATQAIMLNAGDETANAGFTNDTVDCGFLPLGDPTAVELDTFNTGSNRASVFTAILALTLSVATIAIVRKENGIG